MRRRRSIPAATPPFAYADSPDRIRGDLVAGHSRAWDRLPRPGTWLDAPVEMMSADFREMLGLEGFASAAQTPCGGKLRNRVAGVVRGLGFGLLRLPSRRRRAR